MNLIVRHTNVLPIYFYFEKKGLGKYMDLPRIRRNKKEKEKEEKYTSQQFVPRPQAQPPKISSGRAAAHLLEVGKSPNSPKGKAR